MTSAESDPILVDAFRAMHSSAPVCEHKFSQIWTSAETRAVEQRDTRMILFMGLLRASRPNMVASDPRWSSIARTMGIPFGVHND
jgi:hypothetical protein